MHEINERNAETVKQMLGSYQERIAELSDKVDRQQAALAAAMSRLSEAEQALTIIRVRMAGNGPSVR